MAVTCENEATQIRSAVNHFIYDCFNADDLSAASTSKSTKPYKATDDKLTIYAAGKKYEVTSTRLNESGHGLTGFNVTVVDEPFPPNTPFLKRVLST